MRAFEIDVSGSDIFDAGYTVVAAEKSGSSLLLGYKFDPKTIQLILSRYGQGRYRYSKSKKGKADLRVRLYCIAIFFVFKKLKPKIKSSELVLDVCRDFDGRQAQIRQSLSHFLRKLGFAVQINFLKLPADSAADRYAYLLRKDTQNKFEKYLVKIRPEEFEQFLK